MVPMDAINETVISEWIERKEEIMGGKKKKGMGDVSREHNRKRQEKEN